MRKQIAKHCSIKIDFSRSGKVIVDTRQRLLRQ
jgi:hypothetical protein